VTYPASESLTKSRTFDPGLDIHFLTNTMDFRYGAGVFGPKPEYRSLDAIRTSLRDSNCSGPDPVYFNTRRGTRPVV
jgi:hypothetical protein